MEVTSVFTSQTERFVEERAFCAQHGVELKAIGIAVMLKRWNAETVAVASGVVLPARQNDASKIIASYHLL